jgi:type II secretory pathway component GspD/PulD (secretin)
MRKNILNSIANHIKNKICATWIPGSSPRTRREREYSPLLITRLDRVIYTLFICFVSTAISPMLLDKDMSSDEIQKMISTTEKNLKQEKKKSLSGVSSELIDFDYSQKSIKDLVSEFAQKLGINILYPETDPITATVTFNTGRKITIAEAWDFVKMIIEQAGYTLVFRVPGVYALMQNTRVMQEALPLYINVDFNQLPDTFERVRYMYTFSNISVTKAQSELTTLLTDILGAATEKLYILDANSNSIIFTARSDLIKTVMQLLVTLDETGFTRIIEIIKLKHAQAKEVSALFTSVITANQTQKGASFVSTAAIPRARYFSDTLKVLDLDPNNARGLNSVVIIGKQEDVTEVKSFVKKYLDIPQEKGNSFFHVVELEWLKATDFAKVLSSLVKPGSSDASQATGTLVSDLGFDPHIRIIAETVTPGSSEGQSQSSQGSSGSGTPLTNTGQRGGNKLVIACSSRDWQRIQALIKQVDKPQKQVIIEAIVMDLSSQFTRKLGAQIRTQGITTSVFPKHMQAQAALLTNAVLGGTSSSASSTPDPNYYNLVGDLSDILNPGGGLYGAGVNATPSTLISPNSPLVSTQTQPVQAPLNGTLGLISGGKERTGGAWAFFQVLSTHTSGKIFTRPVVMALNNQPVSVVSTVWKNLPSGASGTVNPTINYQQTEATIQMNFNPLISNANSVNLQINLDLNLWNQPDDINSGNMSKRNISTNVFVQNGDVLVLGGILTDRSIVAKRSVPFLERIPVIGNIFASRSKDAAKTQLFIVIRVTVVEPRMHAGMSTVTKSAANYMVETLADTEDIFTNLKDPITRWFFADNRQESPSEYLEDSINSLSKYDYGQQDLKIELSKPRPWHEKSAEKGGDIRIGWFSDVLSKSSSASRPANNDDMQKLQNMLQEIENPFEPQRLTV